MDNGYPSRGASRANRQRSARRVGYRRLAAVLVVTALVAVSCGRPDDEAQTAENDDPTATTAGPPTSTGDAGPGAFADLGTVCGPAPDGAQLDATDVGVTADSIQIGTISDPGFTGRPGLNQDLFDSAEAFTAWCNEAGGINGRRIELKERDAKITEYQARIIEACDEGDFMLVGGGGVFDDQGQKERLACGLPQIPGFVTTPPAIESDLTASPMPNPVDQLAVGDMRWLGDQFPDATQKIGLLAGGVNTLVIVAERIEEAVTSMGWKVVYNEKYNSFGETSWRGYAEGLRSAGVRGVVWVGDPTMLAALLKAMDEIEYHPDFVRADGNIYDQLLVGEGGEAADAVYIRSTAYPFLDPDLAGDNPATRRYLETIDGYDPGGKVANLGVMGFSAWLLFAEAAGECGADLTRDCVWEKVTAVEEWTGGGLHARQNLRADSASECFVTIEARAGEFALPDIAPNEGVFSCDPGNVVALEGDYGQGATCENPAFADDPRPSRCAP